MGPPPMTATPLYRQLAQAQGVLRPYDILVRMHPSNRRLVADLLGCNLGPCIDPHAQAWRIINQNLRGLQARTHTLPEQLSPFARNNNWWEIVTRTARRLGVRFYPGLARPRSSGWCSSALLNTSRGPAPVRKRPPSTRLPSRIPSCRT